MNRQSVTLISILSKCSPQDDVLKKELELQNILHSNEYIELSKREAFRPYFITNFSPERLQKCSVDELSNLKSIISFLPGVLEELIYSLKNGNGSTLNHDDMPSFLDLNSLKKLAAKLESSGGRNYCNISPNEFMRIFDDETIKSIGEDYYRLPLQCSSMEDELNNLYKGKKYCISSMELDKADNDYQELTDRFKCKIEENACKKQRIRFRKFTIGVSAVLLPMFVQLATGMFSDVAVVISTAIAGIAAIMLWIGG